MPPNSRKGIDIDVWKITKQMEVYRTALLKFYYYDELEPLKTRFNTFDKLVKLIAGGIQIRAVFGKCEGQKLV